MYRLGPYSLPKTFNPINSYTQPSSQPIAGVLLQNNSTSFVLIDAGRVQETLAPFGVYLLQYAANGQTQVPSITLSSVSTPNTGTIGVTVYELGDQLPAVGRSSSATYVDSTVSGSVTGNIPDQLFTNSPYTFSSNSSETFAPKPGAPTFNSLMLNFIATGAANYWTVTVTGVDSGIQYLSEQYISAVQAGQFVVPYSNLVDPSGITITVTVYSMGTATLKVWVVGTTVPLLQRSVYGSGALGPTSTTWAALPGVGTTTLYSGSSNIRIYSIAIEAEATSAYQVDVSLGTTVFLNVRAGDVSGAALAVATISHPSGILAVTDGGIIPLNLVSAGDTTGFANATIWYSTE